VFPDDAFRAKMYYSEGGPVRPGTKVRRFFAGLFSLLDLGANLVLSVFRRG
jgi:hypothetical protein